MKKGFSKIATEQRPIYSKLMGEEEQLPGQLEINVEGEVFDPQEPQEEIEAQEPQEAQPSESLNTQGVKGAKLPRINMAFSEANYEYISVISKLSGLTMTQFVNRILDADRQENAETLKQAKELLKLFNHKE